MLLSDALVFRFCYASHSAPFLTVCCISRSCVWYLSGFVTYFSMLWLCASFLYCLALCLAPLLLDLVPFSSTVLGSVPCSSAVLGCVPCSSFVLAVCLTSLHCVGCVPYMSLLCYILIC